MKNNKKIVTIAKILSLIVAIILFVVCFALLIFNSVNTDTIPDKYKVVIYNSLKYISFSTILLSISVPILLLFIYFHEFKSSKNSAINIVKIALMLAIILITIIFLFTEVKQYGIRIELWYRYNKIFIALLILLDCLLYEYYLINTHKYNKKYAVLNKSKSQMKLLTFDRFIFAYIWGTLFFIWGFVGMFCLIKIVQCSFVVLLILTSYITLNFIFMFYFNIKTKFKDLSLVLLIVSLIMLVFLISSYFYMFSVKIIEAIKINPFICGWGFVIMLLFIPTSIIMFKKLQIKI